MMYFIQTIFFSDISRGHQISPYFWRIQHFFGAKHPEARRSNAGNTLFSRLGRSTKERIYQCTLPEAANMAPFENQWSQEDLYTVNPFLIGDGWPMFRSKFAIKFRECIWVLARVDFQPGSFFTDKTANGMKGEEIVILNTVSCKSGSIPTSLGYYRIFAQTPPTSHITHILGEEKHFLRFFIFFCVKNWES